MTVTQTPKLLKDRVILVTGAGDGIGRACALSFAAHGATVILLGRTLAKLEAVYDEIERAGGPQPAIIPLDLAVAGEADYQQLAVTVEEQLGRLDGILHNAAVLGELTTLAQYEVGTWDHVLQVNLTAPFQLTQAMLPLLMQSPDASIVFTSSSVGRQPRAFWGAYGVAKAGLEALATTLADELANISNIRVNTVNPGATRTQMRASAYPGEDPNSLARPEDRVPVFLYLMGPESRGVTAQRLDAKIG